MKNCRGILCANKKEGGSSTGDPERTLQKEKFCFNGELDGRKLEKYCVMTGGADKLLEQAYEQFQFSTRAYHKILKTARTIADMESSEKIKEEHICEALTYRAYDKKYWS